MFYKPFKIKQNALLKKSEIRKIISEILKSFPQLREEEMLNLIPKKETISSTKLVTHNGEIVMVYSAQKFPLVFVLENIIYPTVYMLWKFPNLLPVFTTRPEVFTKLCNGADLMLPGIILREAPQLYAYGKLEKGVRVGINLTSNKAPIAVGVTTLSSFDMYMAAKRGKAVNIYHIAGDHLWALGTTLTIPELGPPEGLENVQGNTEGILEAVEATLTINTPQNKVEPENLECGAHGYVPVTENVEETIASDLDEFSQGVNTDEQLEETISDTLQALQMPVTVTSNTQKDMDELLLYCFLKACKITAKKIEFPILASNFYRHHMLPVCPMGKSVDLKKSSYKKLSKFLSAMENAGIIKLKELVKGVESILCVDYRQNMLKEFLDTMDMPETSSKEENASRRYIMPEIMEMYTVTAAVLPVLSHYDHRKGDNLRVADVRKGVTDYVRANNLQNSSDKSRVNLDPLLKAVLQCPDVDSLKWGDLMAMFLGRMSHSYQISFAAENTVTTKGKLKTIDIQVGRRTGNKKVTLVNNLELYKINIQEFARECQHGVAASTSISTIAELKCRQLLIQGNQVLFVVNLLTEKYKIPMRYIRGIEQASKSKK